MYSVKHSHFGHHPCIELTHSAGQALMRVFPQYGGAIHTVELQGKQAVAGTVAPKDMEKEMPAYKGSNLLPFPNRTNAGKYTWQGIDYTLPGNDAPRTHALHGFIYNLPLSIESEHAGTESTSLTLGLSYHGQHKGYPFPFEAHFQYTLDKNGLTLKTTVKNTGTGAMPVGHGWHPYFGAADIDVIQLKFPPCVELEMNEVLIPTGHKKPFTRFETPAAINGFHADSCYEITTAGRVEIMVSDPVQQADFVFWQEAGSEGYAYLQVYTPPSRNLIAIEPMTCAPDALNNGMGLKTLEANQKCEWICGIGIV